MRGYELLQIWRVEGMVLIFSLPRKSLVQIQLNVYFISEFCKYLTIAKIVFVSTTKFTLFKIYIT